MCTEVHEQCWQTFRLTKSAHPLSADSCSTSGALLRMRLRSLHTSTSALRLHFKIWKATTHQTAHPQLYRWPALLFRPGQFPRGILALFFVFFFSFFFLFFFFVFSFSHFLSFSLFPFSFFFFSFSLFLFFSSVFFFFVFFIIFCFSYSFFFSCFLLFFVLLSFFIKTQSIFLLTHNFGNFFKKIFCFNLKKMVKK